MERAVSQTYADAFLADDRLRAQSPALVPLGPLPGLPHHAGSRPADPRSAPWSALTSLIPALSCRSCRPQSADQGRGAATGGQLRQAAGAVAEMMQIRLPSNRGIRRLIAA